MSLRGSSNSRQDRRGSGGCSGRAVRKVGQPQFCGALYLQSLSQAATVVVNGGRQRF